MNGTSTRCAPPRVTRAAIDEFLAQRRIALAGVSRSGRKFGNALLRDLAARGYEIFPIHPAAAEIAGVRCCRSVAALPAGVASLLLCVPPPATETLVREAVVCGIKRVWMLHGASSPAAIEFCTANGMAPIHHECILMYAQPVGSLHAVHRWFRRIFGRMPS